MMLKQILATAKKDWQLVLQDSSAFATLLLMPLVFILIMSLAMSGMYGSDDDDEGGVPPITLLVVNEDVGSSGTELVDALEERGGFNIITTYEDEVLDRTTADDLISRQREELALIIPANYGESVRTRMFSGGEAASLELMTDPAFSSQLLPFVQGTIRGLSQQAAVQSTLSEGLNVIARELRGLGAIIPNSVAEELEAIITSSSDTAEDGSESSDESATAILGQIVEVAETRPSSIPASLRAPTAVEQNVPAYTLFGVFFIVEVLAANLKRERDEGTFRRLLVAPMSMTGLFLGKLLAFLSINLVQILLMFAVGVFILPLFGAPRLGLGVYPLGLIVISVAVSLAANALGLLVASLSKTTNQVTSLSLMLVIPMAVLSGIMIPRFIMPQFMQQLGFFVPHTWALTGYHEVILRGDGIVDILPHSAALLGFAVVFFGVALWRFRW